MDRSAKPTKAKVEAKRSVSRKAPKNEGARVRDLEKRLAEALKREAEALGQLQTSNRELTEALEQQTATSELLKVIGRSTFDLQPVFETLAANAGRLCAAESVFIFRFDGQLLRVVASHNATPERRAFVDQHPVSPGRGSGTARAALERRTIHIHDAQADPEYTYGAESDSIRTVLAIPMLRMNELLGVIIIYRTEVLPFTDSQIALIETFADQAVIAIENVRLFNETKEALEQQTATGEILRAISQAQTNAQPVFDVIADSVMRLFGAWSALVFGYDGEFLHLTAARGGLPGSSDFLLARIGVPYRPTDDSPALRTVRTRTVQHIVNVEALDASWNPRFREEAIARGFRSLVQAPMLRGDDVVGVIAVTRAQPGGFSPAEIALLQTFADQAVIAIENVRLFKELEARNRDLTATSEILRVISISPTDVQPVFSMIAQSAARLCDAFEASIFERDGDHLRLVAHHGPLPDRPDLVIPVIRGTVTGRCVLDRQIVSVADLQAAEDDFPQGVAFAREFGFHSFVSVPLLREGVAIGAIGVRRTEVQPFTDTHIALLQTFADQAVIAIENVRLFTELQVSNRELTAALDTQTATSDILRVISRSPTDVQPVFEAIVASAVRLLGAHSGTLTRIEGDQITLGALTSTDETGDAAMRAAFPQSLHSDRVHARAIRDRVPVNIADAQTDPRGPEVLRTTARARDYRSVATVPLLRHDEAVGAIAVNRREAGGFTDDEIALLQTFADQAVIAIENARLLSELQARTAELTRSVDELTALGDVGRVLSSTLDLETVLQTIVTRANQLAGADGGSVYEYDEQSEAFHLRATDTLDDEVVAMARRTPVPRSEGVLGRMAVTREPVQIPDIAQEGAYRSPLRDVLLRTGRRALLAVPLLREDHLIGGLTVNKKTPGQFSPEVIDLLRTFASQSALAIQNARLFREIEVKSRQLEAASQHKSEFLANMSHELRTPLNAVIGFSEVLSEGMFGPLNEKQGEYARDIYSSGQHLLSLINDILDLSKIEAGRMELELTDFHLPAALDNALTLVRERAGRRGIALGMTVDARLGEIRADERKIRQVVLNLLSNAIKFTPEGGRIEVRAAPVDGSVEVSVTDTGVGIAPEDQEAIFEEFKQVGTAAKKVEGTGLGLALSRKFIELHGGRIWVKSTVGVGSTFTFSVPVAVQPDQVRP